MGFAKIQLFPPSLGTLLAIDLSVEGVLEVDSTVYASPANQYGISQPYAYSAIGHNGSIDSDFLSSTIASIEIPLTTIPAPFPCICKLLIPYSYKLSLPYNESHAVLVTSTVSVNYDTSVLKYLPFCFPNGPPKISDKLLVRTRFDGFMEKPTSSGTQYSSVQVWASSDYALRPNTSGGDPLIDVGDNGSISVVYTYLP
jgi:hypothetical protein